MRIAITTLQVAVVALVTLEDFKIQDETYRNKFLPDFELHNLAKMDRGQSAFCLE